MGLLSLLGRPAKQLDLAHGVLVADAGYTIRSSDVAKASTLPAEVAAAFGINTISDTVSRKEAMTIPAVRRARNLICGTISPRPIVAMRRRAGNPPERLDRTLLSQPDPNRTRSSTISWTIDDLIFQGWSLWRRLDKDAQGYPTHAERIAPERVSVTAEGLRIDGIVHRPDQVIVFEGPDEGVLKAGARSLRTYLVLEEAVRRYANMDLPLSYFQDSGRLEDDEVTKFLSSWESARRARSTGYVPTGMELKTPSFNAEQVQLAEARGFQAAEIARLFNLPASRINAPTNDSMTYSTTESDRRELVEMTCGPYVDAVEQRLSMGDVTPLGTEVRLDFSRFILGDLKDVVATGAQAVTAELMTRDEVRTEWLNLPPLGDTQKEAPTDGEQQP